MFLLQILMLIPWPAYKTWESMHITGNGIECCSGRSAGWGYSRALLHLGTREESSVTLLAGLWGFGPRWSSTLLWKKTEGPISYSNVHFQMTTVKSARAFFNFSEMRAGNYLQNTSWPCCTCVTVCSCSH